MLDNRKERLYDERMRRSGRPKQHDWFDGVCASLAGEEFRREVEDARQREADSKGEGHD